MQALCNPFYLSCSRLYVSSCSLSASSQAETCSFVVILSCASQTLPFKASSSPKTLSGICPTSNVPSLSLFLSKFVPTNTVFCVCGRLDQARVRSLPPLPLRDADARVAPKCNVSRQLQERKHGRRSVAKTVAALEHLERRACQHLNSTTAAAANCTCTRVFCNNDLSLSCLVFPSYVGDPLLPLLFCAHLPRIDPKSNWPAPRHDAALIRCTSFGSVSDRSLLRAYNAGCEARHSGTPSEDHSCL